MFKIDRVALEEVPNPSSLPCEQAPRKTHLCVRPVCCTSHQMWAGIDVHLGAREDALTAAKTFRLGGATYGVLATAATKDTGWANFKDASEHRAKTLAIWVEADKYHPRYTIGVVPQAQDDEDEPPPDPRTQPVDTTVALVTTHHTVVSAVMRSEEPLIPPDFDATVLAMAEEMTGVRLLVDHGPNMGNQSAALSLIQNLRRAGYAGPIDVLVDNHTFVEMWDATLKFTIPVRAADLDATEARVTAIQQKILDRYAGTTAARTQDKALFKEITIDPGDTVFPLAPGENARFVQCFKDLNFGYTLSVESWDDVEEEDFTGDTEAPAEDLLGNLLVTVNFSLQSQGEESIDAKLKKLDPAYDALNAYANVTFQKKDGEESLPAFADDASATKTIVDMVAGGEAGEGSMETYRKDKTKTFSLVALQPLLWHPENRFFKLKDKAVEPLCLPEAAAYFIDPYNPGDKVAAFKAQVGDEKGDALGAVLAAVGDCDLMVCYGVHQAKKSSSRVVLTNVSAALKKAIAAQQIKKTLLLVLCKEGIDLAFDCDKVVRAKVDATLAQKIHDLQADQILFIHAPPLPQRSFQLLAQAGTLPFLLEGANTCNMMQMLGKPYLSVATDTPPYVPVPGKDGHQKLQVLTDHLNDSEEDSEEERVAALATYFKDAKDAGAVIGGYFPALKDHVRKKPLDQVKWSLYRLQKALHPVDVPSSAQCRPTD